MSLQDLKDKLEEMKQKKERQSTSLKSKIYTQTRCPISHIYIPDPLMDLPTLEEVKIFLQLDKTDELPFIPDKFDCDNFAGALRGKAILYAATKKANWAFGECESDKHGGHRFNIVAVAPNAQVFYIEPQNDSFFTNPGRFKFILF
jgi:hypothetical protein